MTWKSSTFRRKPVDPRAAIEVNDKINSVIARHREQRKSIIEKATAYAIAWKQSVSEINDPALRKSVYKDR